MYPPARSVTSATARISPAGVATPATAIAAWMTCPALVMKSSASDPTALCRQSRALVTSATILAPLALAAAVAVRSWSNLVAFFWKPSVALLSQLLSSLSAAF